MGRENVRIEYSLAEKCAKRNKENILERWASARLYTIFVETARVGVHDFGLYSNK